MENKKTLWIFGDSYSTRYNDKSVISWSHRYINWKGYAPKTFGDIIGEELDLNVNNLAHGGWDNDTIFETILKHAPNIRSGDYIIIGWSAIERFRLADKIGNFKTFIPNYVSKERIKSLEHISVSTIEEVFVNRNNRRYRLELYDRVEFLNWVFKDMKVINWTPFNYNDIKLFTFDNPYTIELETNGDVKDLHYSEEGNAFVATKFDELFKNDELRISYNNPSNKYRNLI